MNATAPQFGAEQRMMGSTAMTPPGRPRWLLLAVAGAGLATLVIGWAVVGGSHVARPVGVRENYQVAANGVVEGASRERPLAAEVVGTLKAVHVQVNQEVPVGALLFELQNDSQQAHVALAEAELAAAQAQLQHADSDLKRARDSGRSISPQDYDANVYRRATSLAKVAEAAARRRLARAELAKTQVRAPVAGRVLQIHKEAGSPVGPLGRGGTGEPVLRLADVSQRRVRAFVEELDAGRVRVGQSAVATADGFPGQEYVGRVVELARRMGKDAPESDAPGEYKDIYYREVVIELDGGHELPLNLRVQVKIASGPLASSAQERLVATQLGR